MDIPDHQIRRIIVERMDRCSICHRRFAEDDVEVVSRKPDVWLMIVQCQDCHSRSFAAALIGSQSGPFDAESLIGFSADESLEITFETEFEDHESGPSDVVDVDDVLSMHHFLSSFDGDFKNLFSSDLPE